MSENGLKNKNNKENYCPNDQLNTEVIKNSLKRIYYNMMLAAADNGAVGIVCPLLSTGYYAGKYKNEMNDISKMAFDESRKEFQLLFPNSQLREINITRNSIADANSLAENLKCSLDKIAIGIAGADNSGTGSLFTDDTRKKIKQIENGDEKVWLPQEEFVRYKLSGAFDNKESYIGKTINEIKYINERNEITKGDNLLQKGFL